MPETYVRFGETWREPPPGLGDAAMDRRPPPGPDLSRRVRALPQLRRVVRRPAIRDPQPHGGVYVDTDVECLRSLEPLIGDATAFAAYARPGLIGSAVVGSVAGHPAIAKTLAAVCAGAGSGRQVEATGPVALTRVLEGAEDVELFGRETFYPFDFWEIPFTDTNALDVGGGVRDPPLARDLAEPRGPDAPNAHGDIAEPAAGKRASAVRASGRIACGPGWSGRGRGSRSRGGGSSGSRAVAGGAWAEGFESRSATTSRSMYPRPSPWPRRS